MTQINPNINRFNTYQPKFKSVPEQDFVKEQAVEEVAVEEVNPQEETQEEPALPEIYDEGHYKNPVTPLDTLKSADVMGFVTPWVEHPILMTGTAGTLIYGIDRFSEACGGDYEKSILGKITKAGDRLENSKFVKKEGTQKFLKTTKKYYDKFATKIRNTSVARAILDTPCIPERSMAKCEYISQKQRIIHDNFFKILDSLRIGTEETLELKELGLDKAEKDLIKKFFKVDKVSAIAEDKAANFVVLNRLKLSEAEIKRILDLGDDATKETKNKLLEAMGTTLDDIKKFKADDTGKYVDDIFEIAKRGKGKIWTGAGEYKILGPFQVLKRKIGMDQLHNNLYSLKEGAKTATGKFFAKATHLIHRGFTFGGGKLGMLMFIAPHFMQTIINTHKAEPEEKLSTAVQGSIGSISWVLTFPLAIKSVYALGGLKHMGMSKDAVEAYREKIRIFNNRTFDSKKAYNIARKQLQGEINDLWKVKDQNLLTMMTRKIAKVFTCDLGQIKPYEGKNILANLWHKKGKFFKNLGNEPLRFVSILAASFLLDAVITKTLSSFLGKTHDESIEEMNADSKKRQKEFAVNDLRERLREANKEKILAASNPVAPEPEAVQRPAVNIPPINLAERIKVEPQAKTEQAELAEQTEPAELKKTENKPTQKIENNNIEEKLTEKTTAPKVSEQMDAVENKYIPSPLPNPELFKNKKQEKRDNYTYIPSSENVIKKNNPTEQLKYIPSQLAANFSKTFDNSGLQAALRRADRAEQKALQTLAGNFGAM